MINLKQIQALEKKINNAVELISVLKRENKALKKAIESSRKRVEDLESLVNEFKSEQFEIEKSILNALTKLDELEDDITDAPAQNNEPPEHENKGEESGSEQSELVEKEENAPVEESFEENANKENENKGEDALEDTDKEKDVEDDTVSLEDEGINELDIF
jgi:chromosome segregation ATPase